MVTKVTKVIGATGDYATGAAAISAMGTNLVTADQQWTLQFQNQVHAPFTISGIAADATRYIELTTAPGASYLDNGAFATTALRYDKTKGASIECSGSFAYAIDSQVPYTRINKLQIGNVATGSNAIGSLNVLGDGSLVDRCLIMGFAGDTSDGLDYVLRMYSASTISNSLIVQRSGVATTKIAFFTGTGAKAVNCGFVSTGAKLNVGLKTANVQATLQNCYVMNVTAPEDGVVPISKTNCYTDATASGWTTVPYSTATFVSVATDGTHDFRLPSGSALIDQGVVEPEGATSINGVSRTTYDIGPWEYVPASASAPTLSGPTGTARGSNSGSGSVATDTAGGTLYFLASTNPTETAATIQAANNSQSVTATGLQNVTFSGLAPSTVYYAHFVQVGTNGTSNVVDSSSFTTTALDTTAPDWPSTTFGSVTTTANGATIVCPAGHDANGIAKYQYSLNGGTSWTDNGTGTTVNITNGLNPSTNYTLNWRALDPSNNTSTVLTVNFTTQAAAGTFKTKPLANNTGTLYASGTAVAWEWHQARVGTSGAITYGSGSIASDGTLTATGLPSGNGFILAAILGATIMTDSPYYQPGTAA